MTEQNNFTEFVFRIYTDGRVERLEDITRCKDCKYYGVDTDVSFCKTWMDKFAHWEEICEDLNPFEFCSFAERKGEDG